LVGGAPKPPDRLLSLPPLFTLPHNFFTMADKFPELKDVDTGASSGESPSQGDFLSREKELLGDEFTTERDQELADDNVDEFDEFESNFPKVDADQEESIPVEDAPEEEAHTPLHSTFDNLDLKESKPIQEWKERTELEISKRDEVAAKKHEEIKKQAEKDVDDFYVNYNDKKEKSLKATKEDEEKFIAKRDSFFDQGSVWDRTVELLKLKKNSSFGADEADKTRFKEILLSLKGKENVPGAAGY